MRKKPKTANDFPSTEDPMPNRKENLELASAVYRVVEPDRVEWLGLNADASSLEWQGSALKASVAPLRDAQLAASTLGGVAIPRALLDELPPPSAFMREDIAHETVDELAPEADGITAFVLPRAVLDSWRRSNSLD